MKSKLNIFLCGYINVINAQNLNCLSIAKYIDKRRFHVHTLSLKSVKRLDPIEGVSVINCIKPYRISILIGMVIGILRCDVAYFPKHIDTPNFILFLAKILNKVSFTTIEMNMCDRTKLNLTDNFGSKYKMKKHFDLISYVFGISRFIISQANCGVKLEGDPLYLGVEKNNFDNKSIRKKLKNIVFIGSLLRRKNIEDFFKLSTKFDSINFHVIGNKKYINITRRKVKLKNAWIDNESNRKSIKIPENVIFHGKLDRYDLPLKMQDMDLLFLPSRSEGFPKVILEAAAASIPSIVYSDYGADEWIDHSVNGFVVNEFGEVVEIVDRLIKDDHMFSQLSSNVVSMADYFNWDQIIKNWEDTIIRINNE